MKLQHTIAALGLLFTAVVYVQAAPMPADNSELDVLQIPLTNGKELDVLTLGARDQEQLIAERNKRTIGLLRELFPDITKEIDSIVNRIIAQVIRVAGPSLLPTLLGNRGGGAGGGGAATSFDADFDDDDDDDDDDEGDNDDDTGINLFGGANRNGTKTTTASPSRANDVATNLLASNQEPERVLTRINIDLPTFSPPLGTNEITTAKTNEVNKVSEITTTKGTTTTTTSTEPTTTTTTTTTTTSTEPTTTTTTTTTETPTVPPSTTINYIASALPTEPTTTTQTPTTTTTTTTPLPTTTTTSSSSSTTSTPPIFGTSTVDLSYPSLNDIFNAPTEGVRNRFGVNGSGGDGDDDEDARFLSIIDNLNRLLNPTNYVITSRDNLTTTTTTETNNINTTVRVTKLLPVNN